MVVPRPRTHTPPPRARGNGHPAGRDTPSVACIVQPGSSGGFQKLFFGKTEVAIPVYGTIEEAARKHPKVRAFVGLQGGHDVAGRGDGAVPDCARCWGPKHATCTHARWHVHPGRMVAVRCGCCRVGGGMWIGGHCHLTWQLPAVCTYGQYATGSQWQMDDHRLVSGGTMPVAEPARTRDRPWDRPLSI